MMEDRHAAFGNIDMALSRFDAVIEKLLVALLAFMPLAFGARSAWSEEVVIILSGAIVVCFLLKLVYHRDQGLVWTWAYVPVILFLLVSALQLISLPAGLVSVISSNTAKLKTQLLGDLSNAEAMLKSMPLSFYPNATRHDLRLVVSVAAVFFVVLNVFRRSDQIKRLLMAMAVIGGIVAAIALAQDIFGNGRIYWIVPSAHSETLSGPFVNHSHYGQFMNLSIGAAIGWLCVKLHEDFAGKTVNASVVFDYISSPAARPLWLLVAITGFGAAAVFVSLTRGGMVSMLIAASLTTLLLSWRRSLESRGWIMVFMALVAFVCILAVGFNAVYDRFATLRVLDSYEIRWQILKDLVATYRSFPVFGTGLGTHSVVYPMFQNVNTPLLFTHAENEYAQVAEETGLVGLLMLVVFGIIIWSSYAKSIHRDGRPIRSAAYGLGFGLLAVLIHSFSDFGQHVPANAFLSAVFCALLLAVAGGTRKHRMSNLGIRRPAVVVRVVVFLTVCGIWGWGLIDADKARIAEAYWKKALDVEKGLVDKNWQGTEAEYADLISYATAASQYQPENIHYLHCLNVYRWYLVSKVLEPDIEGDIISEDSIPFVHDIVDEFNRSRVFCPTYGPVYSIAGQIEWFIFNDDSGAEKIRKGFRLAPCDPMCCFVAGRLDVLEAAPEAYIAKFEKAVQLDSRLFRDVVGIYVNHLSRPRLAVLLAEDNVGRLNYVAGVLEDMQYNDLAQQTRHKVRELLEAKCSQRDCSAADFASLAGIYRSQQADEKAVEYYRRALELDYGRIHWRLNLARVLARTGRIPEAIHEARICLRLRPQFKAAQKLIAELSVMPGAVSKKDLRL